MTSTVVAAAVGAAATLLGVLLTQVVAVYTQQVRALKLNLLDRRLGEVYSPLDYWWAVLASADSSSAAEHAKNEIRLLIRTHGYLMSAMVRADLFRMLAGSPSVESIAESYLYFREEYESLIEGFARSHFSRSLQKTAPK